MSPAHLPTKERWALADGVHGGLPLVIRFRQGLFELPGRDRFPMRLSLKWTYSDSESGMPSHRDSEEMAEFENSLVPLVEANQHGVLAATITNAGIREWIFYVVDDRSETLDLIHRVPQKVERYPIEIERSSDPDWSFFSDLLAGMS